MSVILERLPFTPWKVLLTNGLEPLDDKDIEEINFHEFRKPVQGYDIFFRTGLRQNRECEIFSLMPTNTDFITLQLYIFKDGTMTYFSFMPVEVTMYKRKHLVKINLFASVELVLKNNASFVRFFPVDNEGFMPYEIPILS